MRSTENNDQLEPVMVMARVIDPIDRKGGMRLNGQMKNQVVEKAIAHAFGKRTADLLKEEHALTKVFWLHKFGAAKLKAALLLGEPFVRIDADVYNNKQPEGISLYWNVGGHGLQMRTHMPAPTGGTRDGKFFTIRDETLIARCREWQDATEKLAGERSKVSGTLAGMLQNIASFASLEKNWPEGKPFYKHLPKAFPFRHQVPAVLINELNAALGV